MTKIIIAIAICSSLSKTIPKEHHNQFGWAVTKTKSRSDSCTSTKGYRSLRCDKLLDLKKKQQQRAPSICVDSPLHWYL